MSEDWDSMHRLPRPERLAELAKIFGDPARHRSYEEWGDKQPRLIAAPPVGVEHVSDGLRDINFFSRSDSDKRMHWALDMCRRRLQIPIGSTDKVHYHLNLDPFGLPADKEVIEENYPELMCPAFLGAHRQVQPDFPPAPRSPIIQRELQNSGKSNDSQWPDEILPDKGFMFHTLGQLEKASRLPSGSLPRMQAYHRTDFFVVAEISPAGSATGLWIVHDKFIRDENDELHVIRHHNWGHLPHEDRQISCAKLKEPGPGDLLRNRSLSTPFELDWATAYTWPVELVFLQRNLSPSGPRAVRLPSQYENKK